jgi:hypothetical protein
MLLCSFYLMIFRPTLWTFNLPRGRIEYAESYSGDQRYVDHTGYS